MATLKACSTKRNRSIGLILIGSSFAIQMAPPILHSWANILGVSDGAAMAGISVIYLVLLAVLWVKGRQGKS